MTRVVRTAYRYKRPPRKKKPAAVAVEQVVTIREPKQATKPANDEPSPPPSSLQ